MIEVHDQSVGRSGFSWVLFSWFTDNHLLAVYSLGLLSVHMHPFCLYRFFFFFQEVFIYFWLCWVLVRAWAFSSCRQAWASHCRDFSHCRAWALGHVGSVDAALGLSCPMACGIFLEQEWKMCPLYCKADSQPLDHKGSPLPLLIRTLIMLD